MDWTRVCSISPGRVMHDPEMTTIHLTFKLFVRDNLDAEADLAPLPVAVGLGGFFLRQRRNRNAGGAIAQVDQHAAASLLEMIEHIEHALLPGENIPDDVGLVEPGQHVPAVAHPVIDESDVRDLVE